MAGDDEAGVVAQSGDDDADDGVQSDDNEGPGLGHGAWVEGLRQDPLDPHPFPPRERRSWSELDPDYEPYPSQVMTTRLITT
jgi:hypothetical protein